MFGLIKNIHKKSSKLLEIPKQTTSFAVDRKGSITLHLNKEEAVSLSCKLETWEISNVVQG